MRKIPAGIRRVKSARFARRIGAKMDIASSQNAVSTGTISAPESCSFSRQVREAGQHRRFAIAQEFFRDAADAHFFLRLRRHAQSKERCAKQRRVAQIAEQPPQSVKRRSQRHPAPPQSKLLRETNRRTIPRQPAQRRRRPNRAARIRTDRRNSRTLLHTSSRTARRAATEALRVVRLHTIPVVGILSRDAIRQLVQVVFPTMIAPSARKRAATAESSRAIPLRAA